jgi:hypothetical protein
MHKHFNSFRRLQGWLSMRKYIFLAHTQRAKAFFSAHSACVDLFFCAHSACVGNFVAHSEHAQKTQNGEFLPQSSKKMKKMSSPQVAYPDLLKKIGRKSHTWAPFRRVLYCRSMCILHVSLTSEKTGKARMFSSLIKIDRLWYL